MIRVNQIKITPSDFYERRDTVLRSKIAKLLRIREDDISRYRIIKQSIDARKKPDIYYILTVDIETEAQESVLKRCRDANVSRVTEMKYLFQKNNRKPVQPPIIVGSGPAGLFCAYMLAQNGYCPIVLERGEDVERRKKSVEKFWETGELKKDSNVQFGEGGAGTFSDGKLNTLIKDSFGRNRKVLEIFVEAGAPERILYENKPHLGTDVLIGIVKNMRETIIRCGGQVHFDSEVTDLLIEDGAVKGVWVNHELILSGSAVVLAIGHSARDTFAMLYGRGISMEAKAFAVGLRVEHPQSVIDVSQYGMPGGAYLPAADYKLTAKTTEGRAVYTFCMCPGGYVVDASSEEGRLAVNGMSYSGRDSRNANSAVIVSVTPEDFGSPHPLAGIAFQRELERKAFNLGGGRIPVQYYNDFKENRVSAYKAGSNEPCMRGRFAYTNLRDLMPDCMNRSFIEGMEQFGRKIKGFAAPGTLLSGIESRTSSPIRILRDETMQGEIKGLYPAGEGAGYAGGITSAAMDGIKAAEAVVRASTK